MIRSFFHTAAPLAHGYRTHRLFPLLFEADTGISATTGTAAATNPVTDPTQAFQNALARNQGDAMALATRLFDENYQLRSRNREIQGLLPAQGAVVLPADQAATWQAYQQLGAADVVAGQLQAAQAAATELASLKRSSHLQDVAQIAGYKPGVLATLAGDKELLIRGEGSARTVAIKDGDREVALADYAKTQWADFLPALQATPTPASGTAFVSQHTAPAAATGAPDYLARFQAARDAAPSPFTPKQ